MGEEALLQERLARIEKAVALEKPDRTPIVLEYAGFAARVTNTPLPEFIGSLAKSVETMIQAFHLVGDADAINYGAFSPYGLCFLWMSKIKVPGVELPDDVPHQVAETELMKVEDYDRILDQGWPVFFDTFMKERVLDDVPPELLPWNQKPVNYKRQWASHGVPVLTGGDISTPYELLCGGRSLVHFIRDLFTIPDRVEAVMEAIVPHLSGRSCQRARDWRFPAVWVGGWRSASNMLSPNLWERFVWPYFRRLVHEVVDNGLVAILHLDADWTRDLHRFRELPKGRCILATDGDTDLMRAKEIVGDHLCLMGDVPASMFELGTPDEVYDYCAKLIRELGPEGFILQSGCDIPIDAKLENVQAMVAAATGQ